MVFVVLSDASERGELLLAEGGLCRFRRRRDGTTVIHELIVLPPHRRRGAARRLVAAVQAEGRPIVAKCPARYAPANYFWPAVGFRLAATENGIHTYQWSRT